MPYEPHENLCFTVERRIDDVIVYGSRSGSESQYRAEINIHRVKRSTEGKELHTVCLEAKCPNIGECFCAGTAAFLIMGNICTRNCL